MSVSLAEPVTLVLVVLLDGARLATLRVRMSVDDVAHGESVAKAVPLDAVLSLLEQRLPDEADEVFAAASAADGVDNG